MSSQIKVILPPKFNDKVFRKRFRKAIDEFKKEPQADFEKLVRYWGGEKPKFVPVVRENAKGFILQIRVTGKKGKDKFNWLDYGTRPHKIRAKNAPRLAFPAGKYKAGSKPGTTAVSRARPASGPITRPQEVNHPGNAARGWREIIAKRREPNFHGLLRRAMKDAAQESGHGNK